MLPKAKPGTGLNGCFLTRIMTLPVFMEMDGNRGSSCRLSTDPAVSATGVSTTDHPGNTELFGDN